MPHLIEKLVQGKDVDPLLCEDFVYHDDRYSAVIDGVTTSGAHSPPKPGRRAAEAVAQALADLPADATATDAVAAFGDYVKRAAAEGSRPSTGACVCAVYSTVRNEVWRVGDCHILIDQRLHPPSSALSDTAAAARSAVILGHLSAGATASELLDADPGREAILPLLQRQKALANDPTSPFSYGVINGEPVPERFVEIIPLPRGTTELVLATDGYPLPYPTLPESEAYLRRIIREDPLMIARHPATKGVRTGSHSFDDRAYLRLELP